jgi:hypothetical protein
MDMAPASVEKWFNREWNSWVVAVRNAAGDQLGESIYVGVRNGGREIADRMMADLRAEYGL